MNKTAPEFLKTIDDNFLTKKPLYPTGAQSKRRLTGDLITVCTNLPGHHNTEESQFFSLANKKHKTQGWKMTVAWFRPERKHCFSFVCLFTKRALFQLAMAVVVDSPSLVILTSHLDILLKSAVVQGGINSGMSHSLWQDTEDGNCASWLWNNHAACTCCAGKCARCALTHFLLLSITH